MVSGIASGLSGQVMAKAQSVYLTAVTPDRAYEMISESIEPVFRDVMVPALRGDRVMRSINVRRDVTGYKGDLVLPIYRENMGLILQHAMGQDTVTTITGTARRHTFIQDSLAQQGKFLTIQVGKTSRDGVINPFTYFGGKSLGFDLACNVGEYLKMTGHWEFGGGTNATALATPSWITHLEPWTWASAAVTVGGSAFPCMGFSLKYNANISEDEITLGNVHREGLAKDFAVIEGELTAKFDTLAQYTAFIANTRQALVITFTSTDFITGSTPYVFSITIPVCDWSKVAPKVEGPDQLKLALPFRGLYDGTNAPLTLVADNLDTAA